MQTKDNLIFLTNDDGYYSKGLKNLIKVIKENSMQTFTVAPEKNQSGKSHSITINKFIKIKKINKKTYILNGTPVDCVLLGLQELLPKNTKPVILMSGINIGANMGLDLHYSGTVAAAREGALHGIISVALSIQKNGKRINWEGPNYFIPKILDTILDLGIGKNNFININFPNLALNKVLGIKIVELGNRKPGQTLEKKKVRGVNYIRIPSERLQHQSAKKNEDEFELNKGFITLSFHNCLDKTLNKKNPKKYEIIKRKILE